MKIGLIVLILILSGCTGEQCKPEPIPVPVLRADNRIDEATWYVINQLLIDRYTWTEQEEDPFRRQ